MMSIPKNACPVGGLVPWANGIWPIRWRGPHAVFGWVYTIHEKPVNGPLYIHWNVSQADIVKAMEDFALYKPKQSVQLGIMQRRSIMARKWSFEKGTFFYLVEGSRPGREWSVEQSELEKRIKAAEEQHA
ncbi:MAG: hypothetical protein ABI599_03130 [Flavobacteriales bacterium]